MAFAFYRGYVGTLGSSPCPLGSFSLAGGPKGMEVLIGKLADAWAPQIAEQYLLDNVLTAEGIARSILREEIGAACFNAHAHILLGRTKFCQPGYGAAGIRAAPRPRRAIQSGSSAGTRGTGHRETPGIWWHAPSPVELLVGLAGWRHVVGEEGHESDRPHRTGRTERAPPADLLGCVSACVAAGLNLASEKKKEKLNPVGHPFGLELTSIHF
jgi:hypothetical protein